ncbi:MAG: 2-oxoacid:acceptor oxidoreductase subunit alpha [Chlamydiae bacterium]|nr:2-oxoacid:acceptor oxidoreductase subunit alpha [Chlamydiota bacterium]MBI3276291.1 2-oxoacid:acceptor oxidoreductase subunit alpha [Chlamydiota bacterium]
MNEEILSPKTKPKKVVSSITVRFAGDSGDGMQLTGDQFTDTTAVMGNDFATFPDYPAEIRAPQGTLPGVSSFQIQFSDTVIFTPGDLADVLVAMNPAALKVNLGNVKKGGLMILNENSFDEEHLKKAAWKSNPFEGETLKDYQILKVPLTDLTRNALKDHSLKGAEIDRCKNFFALGMMFWLYDRNLDHTIQWIQSKFSKRPEIVAANVVTLKAGYYYADIVEALPTQIQVKKAQLEPGIYRKVTGNEATAIGLVTAAHLAGKTLFYGSYPITPASSILHELAKYKKFGVKTFQAEDEIAAIGSAIGASFGGAIGVTGTSGPGMCLKAEALNLAVMVELPLIIMDIQRAGPSTGMPTKTEQGDLLQAMYGRNSDSPLAIVAPKTPSDCFYMIIEAVRMAVKYMTPVIFLSEGYLAEAAEPWKLPELESLPKIEITHPKAGKDPFMPYQRNPETLARPWAIPGTPGLEHRVGGLSKADLTGAVSYDPENHQKMIQLRAEKIQKIAQDIPDMTIEGPASGKLLVLGWGGTYGAIYQALKEMEGEGQKVSHAHLGYIHPFPKNLEFILKFFETILVPELNMGQLIMLLRNRFPKMNWVGFNKMKGHPFTVAEMTEKMKELLL